MASGSGRHFREIFSRKRQLFYGSWLHRAAAILWELAPASGRFLQDLVPGAVSYYGSWLQGAAATLWELAPGSGPPFMGVGSREQPPFSGSWLHGEAAILWELAPGSGGHFAGFLQGFQGFLQILQFHSQVLRTQLFTGCLPLGKITKNIFFSFS